MRNQKGRAVHKCTCDTCRNHPCCAVAKEHRAINRVLVTLDERNRRRLAGVLALQWGRGGIQRLNKITGLSRNTIRRGRDEITRGRSTSQSAIRRSGGGRKRVEKNNLAS